MITRLEKTIDSRLDWVQTNLRHSLVSCVIPKSKYGRIPSAVSLVERPCDTPTNHLKVIYNKPKIGTKGEKKTFAVCSKGHTFPDVDKSVNLIEWIEVLKSLGADVFIYHYDIHPNIRSVSG